MLQTLSYCHSFLFCQFRDLCFQFVDLFLPSAVSSPVDYLLHSLGHSLLNQVMLILLYKSLLDFQTIC